MQWDASPPLNFELDRVDGVAAFDRQRDCLACQRLHEDLDGAQPQ